MSKKNNPTIKPELIDEEDEDWLKLEITENKDDSPDQEYIKVLSAQVELSEIEFPRLFELNENILPQVLKKIFIDLKEFKHRIKITLVPNISEICYGRTVGYKITKINLGKEIESISATKIRKELRLNKLL